ncbi:hypothetical protein LCGC14_2264010 [marine sediment metagenome]|uniref:Uncharacterized protein n=1 Tax=marine sediment metagenome TaxID=412755 RepID=A0A0F9FB94_9ZZZZ
MKPILMNGESVRGILEGRKTQTRRVILRPERFDRIRECGFCCPYGQVGDRLWVRETWNVLDCLYDGYNGAWEVGYPFPTIPKEKPDYNHALFYRADPNSDEDEATWRPSIHMPRWASRITLEITGVKVERIQDISGADAIDEGIVPFLIGHPGEAERRYFATLWDSINAKRGYGWDVNPWVWALTFKVVK